MDNNENTVQEVTVEVLDAPETGTEMTKCNHAIDPDMAKGIALIGGAAIAVWEGGKWVVKKVKKTKVYTGAKEKLGKRIKKNKNVEVVVDESAEKEAE